MLIMQKAIANVETNSEIVKAHGTIYPVCLRMLVCDAVPFSSLLH